MADWSYGASPIALALDTFLAKMKDKIYKTMVVKTLDIEQRMTGKK